MRGMIVWIAQQRFGASVIDGLGIANRRAWIALCFALGSIGGIAVVRFGVNPLVLSIGAYRAVAIKAQALETEIVKLSSLDFEEAQHNRDEFSSGDDDRGSFNLESRAQSVLNVLREAERFSSARVEECSRLVEGKGSTSFVGGTYKMIVHGTYAQLVKLAQYLATDARGVVLTELRITHPENPEKSPVLRGQAVLMVLGASQFSG